MTSTRRPEQPESDLAGMRAQVYKDPRPAEHFTRFHERARTRRPDWVYGVVRVITTLYGMVAFRARGVGAEKVPAEPDRVILAPNHFSFMDHFFVGMFLRRQVQFMAKSQLFKRPMQLVYTHGGVFPVRRGQNDQEAFITAQAILERGGCVVMYCEGGRSRTGDLAERPQAGHRQAGVAVGRDGRARRDPRLAAGAQLEAPAIPPGHRPLRRADGLHGRSRGRT